MAYPRFDALDAGKHYSYDPWERSQDHPDPSSFANVTMETFVQGKAGRPIGSRGCMNCHNQTAHIPDANDGTSPGNDFLWSLAVNAYPDVTSPAGARRGVTPLQRFQYRGLQSAERVAA